METTSKVEGPMTGREMVRAELVTDGEMVAALRSVAPRFVMLVASMPEERAGARVPGLDWTAVEVAAHVLTVVRRGVDMRRAETLEELAELNQTCVDEVQERAPDALAGLLAEAFAEGATRSRDPGSAMPLHVGVVADLTTASSYLLADLLVHGVDISRATGQEWEVDPESAAVALRAVLPAVGPWIRPEVLRGPATAVALDLADGGPLIGLWFGDGSYRAGPVGRDADVRVLTAPAPDVLLSMTGRQPAEGPPLSELASWFLPI